MLMPSTCFRCWVGVDLQDHLCDTDSYTPHPGEFARLTGAPASDRQAQDIGSEEARVTSEVRSSF